MSVTSSGLRARANSLRHQGWSYRRIAGELQRCHHLNARLAFRLAHGWTQEEAARRWNERWPGEGSPKTGKCFSYWETWPARGGRAPSPETLQRLAELYMCRPGELLDGEDFGAFDTGSDAVGSEAAASGTVVPHSATWARTSPIKDRAGTPGAATRGGDGQYAQGATPGITPPQGTATFPLATWARTSPIKDRAGTPARPGGGVSESTQRVTSPGSPAGTIPLVGSAPAARDEAAVDVVTRLQNIEEGAGKLHQRLVALRLAIQLAA